SQIRTWRPLAVDRTEVTSYCYAPVGEAPESRARRIRQFEDFYNASGMATPDDLAEFEASQNGYRGTLARWNDFARGALLRRDGTDDLAKLGGFDCVASGANIDNEGVFVTQHRAWRQRIVDALAEQRHG
ncbi:MAG TPA: benzoate 1,2-dioxygenase large subunit, partial [Burkholderiaceae bacterium]|nr:benzoate 1,2-dioxygenase large subunit [Burkholderiaceae bacterium]